MCLSSLRQKEDPRWCPACGKRVGEYGNFCANCGADLRVDAEVADPVALSPKSEESPPETKEVMPTSTKRKIVGPALLPIGSFANNAREKNAAPFPRCRTTEEILACQEKAHAAGLTIAGWGQRPLALRAPKAGEKGVIVAESIDNREPPLVLDLRAAIAATGTRNSRLWVVNEQYPLLGSLTALAQYDADHAARTGKPRSLPNSGKILPPKPDRSGDPTRRITIWRLIAHHEEGERLVQWSLREGAIAIGWGAVGDLNHQQFADASELTQVIDFYHPGNSSSSTVNGGRSLWRLFYEMEVGDLVILNTGVGGSGRTLTMRVTGDYYYVENDPEQDYEHRRKAEAVPIEPNRLWAVSGGTASGESPRWTLIRCENTLSEAEYRALFRSA